MPAMRTAVKLVVVLTALGFHPAALPFSAEGHRVVGEIAEAGLCAETREWLAPLLQGNTLASAGVWADAIREDPAWEHTRKWHYVNVDDDAPLAPLLDARAGNVLTAIRDAERDLADERLPVARRAEALRFFVHFVADVHQPLHVGRESDRGGNEIGIRRGGERLTLHELWDARDLLRAERLPTRELAHAIGALAVGQALAWQSSTPLDWAAESRAWRPVVYALPPGPGRVTVSAGYVAAARNVVALRLAQAGVRLAGRLDRLGCPSGTAGKQRPSR
jgi:hypothetical protein